MDFEFSVTKVSADGAYHVEPKDLNKLLFQTPGLIIGPDILHDSMFLNNLNIKISKEFNVEMQTSFFETVDEILIKEKSDTQIINCIRSFYLDSMYSPQMKFLASIPWAAVLSFDQHGLFDRELLQTCSSNPTRWLPKTITDPIHSFEPRTFPIYKLLGDISRPSFIIDSTSYLTERTKKWRYYLPDFMDYVKDHPIFCLGLNSVVKLLEDLFAEFSAMPKSIPSSLVFLNEDPIAKNWKIQKIVPSSTKKIIVHAGLNEIAISSSELIRTDNLSTDDSNSDNPYQFLNRYQDIVNIVNSHLETDILSTEHRTILDALFSPAVLNWAPYIYNYDFKRTISESFEKKILKHLNEKKFLSSTYVLQGSAGCGKTTFLKRIAFNIAKLGPTVLWLKQSFYQDTQKIIYELFKKLRDISNIRKPVVIFLDDPFGLGGLHPKDIVISAKNANLEIALIVGIRTSDWETCEDKIELLGGLPINVEELLPEKFDEHEIKLLPEYLCKIEVFEDMRTAKIQIDNVKSIHARDILCLLYFLIPSTRNQIQSSITGEYFRLGDLGAFNKVLIGASQHSTKILQDAYGMVAVSDHAHAALPIEVLVSALNIEYSDWVKTSIKAEKVWGILYSEPAEDEKTIFYHTRNSLVSNTLVEVINGGSLSFTGEANILYKLLSSCSGSSATYREFCISVLVPYRKLLRFEYEQGLRLYDAAIKSLPVPDKTLLHHKALWIHKKGQNPDLALDVLQEAATSNDYPYATHVERDEHIQTSMAACVVSQFKQKRINSDDAKSRVAYHLDQARAESFMNPNPIHVQAGLTVELLSQLDHDYDIADAFQLANNSIAEIDRTLLLIKTKFADGDSIANDVKLLEEARDNLLLSFNNDDFEKKAEEIWLSHKRQEGFIIAARYKYKNAIGANKGTDFNNAFQYCLDVMDLIQNSGDTINSAMYEVALNIYYHWRVRRAILNPSTEKIDWNLIFDYAKSVLRANHLQNDPIYKYLIGLALSHLGRWVEGKAVFAQIRGMKIQKHIAAEPRDFLLSEKGKIRRVQGTVRRVNTNVNFYVDELGLDFIALNPYHWPKDGLTTHGYIQFSFNGPCAVNDI